MSRSATMVSATTATAAIVLLSSMASSQPYDLCDVSKYYSGILDLYDRSEMHALVKNTHRNVLPYTSSSPDVWDALIALDDRSGGTNVELIYGDKEVPATPHDSGSCTLWNREHLWARSRGVGDSGPDNTDIHHLRPADCNVNSARSNRYFAACGVALSSSECTVPAHVEAAADTSRDADTFMPPADHRGDVARAIFYMDLRYDGDGEAGVEDLVVSDCPESVPNGAGMGYLSQLLQWHIDDPPDAVEKLRNDEACRDWQGNRNPFVDYPGLVSAYFGAPRPLLADGLGYDCDIPQPPTPTAPLTSAPTSIAGIIGAPTRRPSSAGETGSCMGMDLGDVAIVGMRSDNPDSVALVALVKLPAGARIFLTDNAWTGSALKTNEGTKMLLIPSAGIDAGEIFGFENDAASSLSLANSWTGVKGSLLLSESGDGIFVYCLNGSDSEPFFLFGATYQNDWQPADANPDAFTTNGSARPAELPSNCDVSLVENTDNWWYVGAKTGNKADLLDAISDSANWSGSNSAYDADIGSVFTVKNWGVPPSCTTAPLRLLFAFTSVQFILAWLDA